MLSHIQDRYSFEVTGTQMEFAGYCANCQSFPP
jgi:hypothetical protein